MPNILFDPTIEGLARTLTLHQQRHEVLASNLANASTTRTPEGGPYRRRNVVFAAEPLENDFGETLASLAEQGAHEGVTVTDVVEDRTPPRMVFDPSHPDANADGYVAYPNVDPMAEAIHLMHWTGRREANVQLVN